MGEDAMSLSVASDVSRRTFSDLAGRLGALMAPNEAAFLSLGDALGAARARLNASGALFNELSERIEREDGERKSAVLGQSHVNILAISAQAQGIGKHLAGLAAARTAIGRPLANLSKIVGEIAALATNAKVQAAQVNAAGVDFSVFTKDIDRLRGLAETAIRRAETRLSQVVGMMAHAEQDADGFRKAGVAELERIATRLRNSHGEMTRRRAQARRALDDFQRRAVEVGQRVSRCISALQINDMTSQRIAHVQAALSLLCNLVDESAPLEEPGMEWVGEMDHDRRRSLVAAVCSLQATQLDRAVTDFSAAIADLRRNLDGLAADAEAIRDEAHRAFGGEQGGESFVQSISADVVRAAELLKAYCVTDERVRAQIGQVSAGFTAMAEDLEAIRSIDADMRIMGLNATLKCTRLGRSGLALGVVAQELRACSQRTEETSKTIAAAIDKAAADASTLAATSADEHAAAASLSRELEEAAAVFCAFGDIIATSLRGVNDACGEVGRLLTDANGNCAVGQRMAQGSAAILHDLHGISAAFDGDADPAAVRRDIERMLGQQYTMASERVIHELFADADDGGDSAVKAADSRGDAGTDIDDLFF